VSTTPPDAATLKAFIAARFLKGRAAVADDQSLLESGLIDSFSLVDLRHFIEDTYGVTVPDMDLTPERMDTVRLIMLRVAELRAR
jgi:acyl carrier protein